MSNLPGLLKGALALYALGCIVALICIIYMTDLTMKLFFFIGLESFRLAFLAYAKVVWDHLRGHGETITSGLPPLLKMGLTLYVLGSIIALLCLIHTTAVTMTLFFFIGLGTFGLGFVAYAKVVWDDLCAHGVL